MPDFSEILKIAVEQQDWQLICGLYTNITGEPLSVPTEEEIKKEDWCNMNNIKYVVLPYNKVKDWDDIISES